MTPNPFSNLRAVLAALYPDEPSIRRIAADAGIDLARIELNSSAINIWHSVLIEAIKTNRINALLDAVASEYGSSKEYQTTSEAYRRSVRQSEGLTQSPKPEQDQPSETTDSSGLPVIVYDHKVSLPPYESLPTHFTRILRQIFNKHSKVLIDLEFGGGFGGTTVFHVRPYDLEKYEQLPSVVKLGTGNLIRQEQNAFEQYIDGYLPSAIPITKYSFSEKEEWGGLRYPLAGEGAFRFKSLRKHCEEQPIDRITAVLESQLFKALDRLYRSSGGKPISMHRSYDTILPVNLLIEPMAIPADSDYYEITTQTVISNQALKHEFTQSDYVCVKGFKVLAFDHEKRALTLTAASESLNDPSFRVRFQPVDDLDEYKIDQEISLIEGKVQQTRYERLLTEATAAFDREIQFSDKIIHCREGIRLPNPLWAMVPILSQYLNLQVGNIHGDLNFENVLVYETNTINLIDFAAARRDHLLHDFLRLETETVTKLVYATLTQLKQDPIILYQFYINLHGVCDGKITSSHEPWIYPELEKPFRMLLSIRTTARKHFVYPECSIEYQCGDWTEYYQCLTLYLLGAMKFKNLSKPAKQLAIIGAATLVALLQSSTSSAPDIKPPKALDLPVKPIWFEWVRIPPGAFMMGEPSSQNKVETGEYWIAKTEVTNHQYKQFVDATKYSPPIHWSAGEILPGKEDHPVVNVSYEDALAFCQYAGVVLPTEAEWEKAARGPQGYPRPWGKEGPNENLCNYDDHVGETTSVYQYPDGRSGYGVLDMAGNVWEWTAPMNNNSDSNRVIRGGCFNSFKAHVSCVHRIEISQTDRRAMVGFRVAYRRSS